MVGRGQLRQYAGLLNDTAFADAALSEDSLPGSEAFWNGGSRSHRSPRGAPETGRGIPRVPAGRVDELGLGRTPRGRRGQAVGPRRGRGLLRRPRPRANSSEGRGSRGSAWERRVRSGARRASVPRYLGEFGGPRGLRAGGGDQPALTSRASPPWGRDEPNLSQEDSRTNVTFIGPGGLGVPKAGGFRDALDLAFRAWTSVRRRCDRVGDRVLRVPVRLGHLLAGIGSGGYGDILLCPSHNLDPAQRSSSPRGQCCAVCHRLSVRPA